MLPLSSHLSRSRTWWLGALAALSSTAMLAVLLTAPQAPAAATTANPITPGNFTGYGFDQCNTPTQKSMDAWLRSSPFRAVGVYISGNSRFCREQKNLTPTWVRTQLAKGWRLLPITLGPQASCLSRFPRYGKNIDPTINPSSTNTYAAARAQAVAEARNAVSVSKQLGIVPGSTIYYDLEGFDLKHSANCRNSAQWFLSSWTKTLHSLGYASGVYSSAGSGIVLLDQARRARPVGYVNPDQIWIARWDGKANTSTTYISEGGWAGQRIKQYRGGHNETHGGVTINIDSNYLSVRTPVLPGAAPAPAPAPMPTTNPASRAPRYTGVDLADGRCTRASISKRQYRAVSATVHTSLITALQCVLKQQRHYPFEVTGNWNPQTTTAVRAFQRRVGHRQHDYATRSDWVALLSRGSTITVRQGQRSAHVIRLQRALNAATNRRLPVTGYFGTSTRAAVKAYQTKVKVRANGVVTRATWTALHRGQR